MMILFFARAIKAFFPKGVIRQNIFGAKKRRPCDLSHMKKVIFVEQQNFLVFSLL